MYAFLIPVCSFIAFLFLLLVSLSAPIVHSIYLFSLSTSTTIPVQIDFGVWGYCVPNIHYTVVGVSRVTAAYCSPPHLGWTFDNNVTTYLKFAKSIENTISATTTAALVLHPIATGLTFLTFVLSLSLFCTKSPRKVLSIALVPCIISVILTTIIFLIDIIVVSLIRNSVRDATDGVIFLTYGNAIWLTLVAAIMLWVATFAVSCVFSFLRR